MSTTLKDGPETTPPLSPITLDHPKFRELLRAVLYHVDSVAICEVDQTYTIVWCNQRFARDLGDDVLHVVGKTVFDITSPEDKPRTIKNFEALLSRRVVKIQQDKHYVDRRDRVLVRHLDCVAVWCPNPKDDYMISFLTVKPTEEDEATSQEIENLKSLLSESLWALSNQQRIGTMNKIDNSVDNSIKGSSDIQAHGVVKETNSSRIFYALAIVAGLAITGALGTYVAVNWGGANVEVSPPNE